MQKKFLTNLGLLLFLNLLIKPFWILGIDRSVQNIVGTENFGFYFSLLNFSILFNILLDFGVTTYNNRNIAQNQDQITEQFYMIALLKLCFAILYTAITFLAGYLIGYNIIQFKILALLCLNQFLHSFIMFLRSNLSGLHLFKTDAIVSIMDRFFMILICGILLWGNLISEPFQILWFVYAQTASYLIAMLIAIILVMGKSIHFQFRWNLKSLKEIFTKSLPFALMVLLMSIYMRIDAVMLERLLIDGKIQVGIYAQGYRLLEAVNMFAYLIAVLLLPIFSKMIKEKQPIESLTGLSFSLIIVPAFIIGFCSLFFSNEIMNLLYTDSTVQSSPVFVILMLCFIPISTTYVLGTLLTANGNLKELNLMASFGILVNIILNFLLIPEYQAKGAAMASIITQIGTAIIQIILVQYIFQFKVNYKLIISLFVFILSVGTLGYFLAEWTEIWYLNLSIIVICAGVLSIVLSLIQPKKIYNILMMKD